MDVGCYWQGFGASTMTLHHHLDFVMPLMFQKSVTTKFELTAASKLAASKYLDLDISEVTYVNLNLHDVPSPEYQI